MRQGICLHICAILFFTLIACNDEDNFVVPFPGGKAGPLLFVSSRSGSYQLYSMEPDGTNIRQLTTDPSFPIFNARWSPDGSKIVVESTGGFENYGPALYVFSADGSQRWRLTKSVADHPNNASGSYAAWSPDSRRLVFSRLMIPEARGNFDIFLINADASGDQQLTRTQDTAEFAGDWSLDGQLILGDEYDWVTRDSLGSLIANDRIAWFTLDGTVVNTQGQLGSVYVHPRYSRKGDRIVYMSSLGNAQNLYVSNIDGSAESKITQPFYSNYNPVDWSPDDSLVLYNAGPTNFVSGTFGKIFLGGVNTNSTVDITPWNDSIYSYAVSWLRR